MTSKLRLPELTGIEIEYKSNEDAEKDIVSFLNYCTPTHLSLFTFNCWRNLPTEIKSEFYIKVFSKVVARTFKEAFFFNIDFSTKDLQTVVKAACNVERIAFRFCCIHCSSGLDFGADLSYKTKHLSFQCWGALNYRRTTTCWIKNPSCFSLVLDAIGNCGLWTSLQKLNIYDNQTLSASKVQEELNSKDMSHISVIEENEYPLLYKIKNKFK